MILRTGRLMAIAMARPVRYLVFRVPIHFAL